MSAPDRRTELLDLAQTMIQERGFNAFSFKDLANRVGIKTASVHYHFPSKGELGLQVMERYLGQLDLTLQIWAALPNETARLRAFVSSYRETEVKGAICLCGSMASDIQTLDAPMQTPISAYLKRSEAWVTECVQGGLDSGEFHSMLPAQTLAMSLLPSLQGALILSRAQRTGTLLAAVEQSFFASLGVLVGPQ
ncbi:MAG: TetR/AcrR family transcriptional repressor of nem operon [Cognaticolwellia sp.]|jgi:TetR/AcrR family transcriptional repressor of nem operon